MSKLLYANKKETSYENFIAWCPYCNYKNIFNRITDLKTTEAIGFMEVKCLNDVCGKEFNINGDSINPAFQMLVFDCYGLTPEMPGVGHQLDLVQTESTCESYRTAQNVMCQIEGTLPILWCPREL